MKKLAEKLNWSELWLRDIVTVAEPPGFFELLEVDMSHAQALIKESRSRGLRLTYTHILVRAVAKTFIRHPKLHQLTINRYRYYPERIDIGLSIANNNFVAPVMVLKDAGNKSLQELTIEIINRTEDTRNQQNKMLKQLNKWGWLVPFSCLRRWLLLSSMNKFSFRRDTLGTFQVTCLPNIDILAPLMFYTSAVLAMGGVKERPIVKDGKVFVRPTAILACTVDHKVWDGLTAAKFLTELALILESRELEEEI